MIRIKSRKASTTGFLLFVFLHILFNFRSSCAFPVECTFMCLRHTVFITIDITYDLNPHRVLGVVSISQCGSEGTLKSDIPHLHLLVVSLENVTFKLQTAHLCFFFSPVLSLASGEGDTAIEDAELWRELQNNKKKPKIPQSVLWYVNTPQWRTHAPSLLLQYRKNTLKIVVSIPCFHSLEGDWL